MSRTALLLIDVQQSFRHRSYWSEAEVPAFFDRLHALADGCAAAGIPIVRIFHSDDPDHPDNPFAKSGGLVRPIDGLKDLPIAVTFEKHRHSALVGTGLGPWLKSHGIERLIISGIRTEQCCETTARHASDEGWEVDYVTEATLTFDMRSPAGRRVDTAQLRERTETVLQGRFAAVCTVEQALERARAAEPAVA